MSNNKLNSLNCIVCFRKLKLIELGFTDIYATEFKTNGHYGSSIIDSCYDSGELRIVICDKCLAERSNAIYEIRDHEFYIADKSLTKRQKQLIALYEEVKSRKPSEHIFINRDTGKIDQFLSEEFVPNGFWYSQELLKKAYGENYKEYYIATVGQVKKYFVDYHTTTLKGPAE